MWGNIQSAVAHKTSCILPTILPAGPYLALLYHPVKLVPTFSSWPASTHSIISYNQMHQLRYYKWSFRNSNLLGSPLLSIFLFPKMYIQDGKGFLFLSASIRTQLPQLARRGINSVCLPSPWPFYRCPLCDRPTVTFWSTWGQNQNIRHTQMTGPNPPPPFPTRFSDSFSHFLTHFFLLVKLLISLKLIA